MKSPFKFLDSYTKYDRDIFFGRDREIEELYQRVFNSKLLLVYGVSGTGKSSLIHCGLANKFLDTDWLPLVIRRGGTIIESMASAIKTASITEQQSKFATPGDFKKGVRSLYLDHYKPVFFIFDQFEELFIFGDKDERKSFIHIVKTLAESDLQCRMIFVMREEYMAWVTEFEKVIPTFFNNRVRIEKMSHINALEAITGPCNAFNISLEEGFAESLLEKLSPGETEVELTYLQVFLDKIFRLATQNLAPFRGAGGSSPGRGGQRELHESEGKPFPSFTLSLLEKTGNVSDLLGSFLDDQISLMEDPEMAMTVLKAFVSGKGTKRPASEQEAIDNIRSFGKEIPQKKVKELILSFVKLRVLRDKDDYGRYELRHDALAEKVYEKFSTTEKELLEVRQFIESSYQSYLKRKVILSNEDLAYIANKDSLLNLNSDLKDFLSESRKSQLARIKTVKRLTLISAIVFVILISILGYYVIENLAIMNANRYAIKSLSETKTPVSRLHLAARAWESSPGLISREALLKAYFAIQNSAEKDSLMERLYKLQSLEFEQAPVDIQYAECSKDGKHIIGYGESLALIWSISGHLEKTIKTDQSPLINIKMSDDSKYIGCISSDSLLSVWNIDSNKKYSIKTSYNRLNTNQIFKFDKNSNVLCLSAIHDAVLLDTNGYIIQAFDRHSGRVNAIDISPDNRFLATASSDKTINIWYFNSIRSRYEYYNNLTWHKDTIWSVSFSNRNINVLSASADSTVKVGSINNEEIYPSVYRRLFPFDRQYCYAEFSISNRGITAICYNRTKAGMHKTFLALHEDNPTFRYNISFYQENNYAIHGPAGIEFLHFVFSPEESCFIYYQHDKTYLAENKLEFDSDKSSIYNLLELGGSRQFFTSDGKYILSVEGNKLKSYFIDAEDIYNLAQ